MTGVDFLAVVEGSVVGEHVPFIETREATVPPCPAAEQAIARKLAEAIWPAAEAALVALAQRRYFGLLGQRAAAVAIAGLIDPRAQARVTAQLLR
jgi:hypothetical protein